MTEMQQLLLPYVRQRATSICESKACGDIRPDNATLTEIASAINADITECMRELIRLKEFSGGKTVNKIPMLFKI